MMYKFRQLMTNLLWLLLLLYVLVLLLQATGLWDLTVTIVRIGLQVIYGFFFALIMEVWIHRMPMKKRWMKVLIVYATIGIFIALLLWFCIPKTILWYQELSLQFPHWQMQLKKQIPQDIWEQAFLWIPTISSFVLQKTQGIMNSLTQMGFILTSAIFISLDLHHIVKGIRYFITIDDNFIQTADTIIFQYTKGVGLDLLFLYSTFCILLVIFQFPESYVFAGILALLNLLPIIGPMMGWGLLLFLSFFTFESFPFLLIFLVFLFQQIESNWVQPLIFKKVMHLRPIVTLISLLVCSRLFGIFGMLFSPIIAGIVQLLFQSFLFTKHTKTVGSWEDVWYNFQD